MNYLEDAKRKRLHKFFEENNIPEYNRVATIDYLQSIERIGRAAATIGNNIQFMRFLITHTDADINKLTRRDVDYIQDEINNWTKKDCKPASKSSKHLMKVMLRRFLVKYGKSIGNKEMIEAADFDFAKVKGIKLENEDILTEDEVNRIISACRSIRDKAVISLLYESGARVGEIEKLKIKDVKDNKYGFHVTLNGKTGKRQVIIHQCQEVLKLWLNAHPDNQNPESPLFTTVKQYNENSFSFDKLERERAQNGPHKYNELKRGVIDSILKTAAERAGIKKRIYPHLLRHSQATRLANTLTEQQLKKRMGWTGGSTMAATYVHLADQDVDEAVLQTYGIEIIRDKKGNEIRKCIQCGSPVTAGLMYCSCGQALTEDAVETDLMLTEALTTYFAQHPEAQNSLMKNILGM